MKIELLIENSGSVYTPLLEDGIVWTTQRSGVCGELAFSVLKDESINFKEGNAVRLRVNDTDVFSGFVFTKERTKDRFISVTAYDQLRYLKNRYPYVYTNLKANEVLQMIAEDFQLTVGETEDTGYAIPSRVEDNTTLFDIVETAIRLTYENTGAMFVLYDDFGKLALKNIESLFVPVVVDAETAIDYEYASTIDRETYNKVELVYADEEVGKKEVYVATDDAHVAEWGVLQYFDTLEDNEHGQTKAEIILGLRNRKRRTLSIQNAFGDLRVRGGSMIIVQLNIGDMILSQSMLVESCEHVFREGEHFMDLKLVGGEFESG
ncbi:MAG: hydrolase [Bacillota bacterium]